jgi:hypothetical protein
MSDIEYDNGHSYRQVRREHLLPGEYVVESARLVYGHVRLFLRHESGQRVVVDTPAESKVGEDSLKLWSMGHLVGSRFVQGGD